MLLSDVRCYVLCVLGVAILSLSACFQAAAPMQIADDQQPLERVLQEDASLTVQAPGVLAAYQLPRDQAFQVRLLSNVFNGELDLQADGSYTYTPSANFFGTDSFLFQILNGDAVVHTGTVVLDVTNVQDSPIGGADAYSTVEDKPLRIKAPGILANDSDPDGEAITFEILDEPKHGRFEIQEDGGFTFQPDANWHGETQFRYKIHSGGESSDAIDVSINVASVNDRPRLRLGTLQVEEGAEIVITEDHIHASDADNEDGALRIEIAKLQHGVFELKSQPGKRLKAFSQSHITKGNVIFKHNNSNQAPAFIVELSDGKLKVEQRMSIQFKAIDDKPNWKRVGFPISEGERLVLTNKHILALDEETTRTKLRFSVVEAKALQVLNQNNKPVKLFTMQDLESGYISVQHDGSENKPILKLGLKDAKHTVEQAMRIAYKPINDAPEWKHSAWEQSQGERLTLGTKHMLVHDPDHKPMQLKMKVLSAKHLQFAHIDAPETHIHTWSYQALLENKIVAIHDGSKSAPSCVIEISDGKQTSQQSPSISFKRLYHAPQLQAEAEIAHEGAAPIHCALASLLKLQIADADGDQLQRLELRLLDAHDQERLSLAATSADDVQVRWEQGLLSMQGTASIKRYLELLQGLHYHCEALLPGQHQRRLQIQASDAENQRSEMLHITLRLRVPAPDPAAVQKADETMHAQGEIAPSNQPAPHVE